MTITVTFDPPVPSDSPAVFNTKAFTLLGDLNDWTAEANALAVEVNADEVALAAAVSSASTSASTATTQSGAATTQAGIATTKAGEAATSAGTAATQAGTATTQAGIATTKAGEANTSAIAAAGSAAATSSAIVTERTNAATLTNKTLTSPDINGGTVDGTVIGGAVPVAGSFTTLSASGGLSVTGGISATGVVSTSGGIRSGNGVIDTGFSYSDKGVVGTYSNHSLGFMVNESEKMTLDTSGNLGLGVVPVAGAGILQVSAGNQLACHGDNFNMTSNAKYVAGWKYIITGTPALQYEQLAGNHSWYTAPSGTAGQPISFTQAMTLDASGNLLLGTTSNPEYYRACIEHYGPGLSVKANNAISAASIGGTNSGICLVATRVSDGIAVYFERSGVSVGTISVTASSTTYNTSSDYRLKNITGPVTDSGAYIDSLKPVQGTWKADGSTFVGLIAHEAQEASRTNVATGTKDGDEMQGMDYSSAEIIANLIAEIQSLRQRLATAGI